MLLTPVAKIRWRGCMTRSLPSARRSVTVQRLRFVVVAAAGKLGAGPEVQLQALDIGLEPVRQLVLGDVDRPGRRERHIGQVVDVHLVVQGQRVIAHAPVVADARVPVDDQRVDAELRRAARDGQARPGRRRPPARPDRGRRRRAPCGAGRASSRRRNRASSLGVSRRRLNCSSWPCSSSQRGDQRPGAPARRRRARAARRRCRGRTRSRTRRSPRCSRCRRGATQRGGVRSGGIWKLRGLRARQRLGAASRSDGGAAGHGLDRPGEGEHVAPQPVRHEQLGRGGRVARRKAASKRASQAALLPARRIRVRAFGDVHRESSAPSPRSFLERVERFHRLARRHLVGIERGDGGRELVGVVLRSAGAAWPARQTAADPRQPFGAARSSCFELGQHQLGALDHAAPAARRACATWMP